MKVTNTQKIYIAGVRESIWIIALSDFYNGLGNYRLWMFLGWQDIRQRYRRSILGPLWLTLSTAIMVSVMSILYSRLFNLEIETYTPFLVSGSIIWSLISSLLNEGCTSFTAVDSLIRQVRMPLTIHVSRVVWRNLIIFFHNAIILIPIWIIFDKEITFLNFLSAFCGLFILTINGLCAGVYLGALCARFRDIGQIIASLVQVIFFITPIMWMPAILEGRGITWWLVVINPFFHFIEIIREPLLNKTSSLETWLIVLIVTLFNCGAAIFMLGRFKKRIVYWL